MSASSVLLAANKAADSPCSAEAEAALGNKGSNYCEEPDRRRSKYALQDFLRANSELPSVRLCGLSPLEMRPGVAVEINEAGRARFSGQKTCGSVWACPICSPIIQANRALELSKAFDQAYDEGFVASMITVTMRHSSSDALEDLWKGLSPAIAKAFSQSTRVKRLMKEMGADYWVGRRELTHGNKNGWHLHAHFILLIRFPDSLSDEEEREAALKTLEEAIFSNWTSTLVRKGFPAPSREHGIDARILSRKKAHECAGYITASSSLKESLALEIAGGSGKKARHGNRMPGDVLASAEAGSAADKRLWKEYELATKGKRQMTYSKGFKEYFGLNEEAAESSEPEVNPEEVWTPLVLLEPQPWRQFRSTPGESFALLAAAEAGFREAGILGARAAVVARLRSLGLAVLDHPETGFMSLCWTPQLAPP